MKQQAGFTIAAGIGVAASMFAISSVGMGRSEAIVPPSPNDPLAQIVERMVDGMIQPQSCALFAPGTPWERVEEVTAALHGDENLRFSLQGSTWFGQGNSGTLTYSFPPDGLTIPAAIQGEPTAPNEIHARLNTIFASQGGEPFWKDLFKQVFDRWTEITGVEYIEVSDDGASWGSSGSATRGDIRIVMKPIDGAGGVLAYNRFPNGGGDMVLDRAENWGSTFANYRFFRNIVSHEHGHGLGFLHVCPAVGEKLMEPFLNTSFDGPQLDDIRAGIFNYGDRNSPNQSAGQATSLGALNIDDSATMEEVGLRNNNDVDYYSFTAPSGALATITVSPIGVTYVQGPQTQQCDGGNSFNALTIMDLQFSLRDSNDNVLASVNQTGFGEAEELVEFDLPGAGEYFIRVSAADSNGVAQVYTMDVALSGLPAEPCPADITGDGQVGSADLAIVLGEWGEMGSIANISGSGQVGSGDLAIVLGNWGACP